MIEKEGFVYFKLIEMKLLKYKTDIQAIPWVAASILHFNNFSTEWKHETNTQKNAFMWILFCIFLTIPWSIKPATLLILSF